MSFANDILDAIEIMVKQVVEDNATKIYTGVCKTIGVNNCVLTINGKDNTVKYYGGVPVVGTVYQVFIPFGNMSAAFIIVPVSGGGSGGSGVDSVNGKTGDVVLNAADVGLGNVDNIKQYSASNPPPYPVVSVNGKTGGVNLIASDVGAAPAGYGLGTTAKLLTSDDNLDNIRANGFYGWASSLPTNAPTMYMSMRVENDSYTGHVVQTLTGWNDSSNPQMRRIRTDSGWQPWEYINPPMELGKEYRTTERYLGKPVYTQIINCGSMPDIGSEKTTSIAAFNVGVVTFISGWCTYYGSVIEPNIFGIALSANTDYIRFANINREVNSNAVMYTLVKYTKNTD